MTDEQIQLATEVLLLKMRAHYATTYPGRDVPIPIFQDLPIPARKIFLQATKAAIEASTPEYLARVKAKRAENLASG